MENAEKLEKLTKKVDSMASLLKKLLDRIEKIEDYLDSSESEASSECSSHPSNYGFGPKPEPVVRHPSGDSYTVVLSHGPYTVHRRAGQDEVEWEKTKKHLLYQRVKFLNCTGVTGTPEQLAYLKEMYENCGIPFDPTRFSPPKT